MASLVELTAERTDKKTGSYQKEVSYYISNLVQDAKVFNECIRSHRGIENRQHWILDVAFREDQRRKRAANPVEELWHYQQGNFKHIQEQYDGKSKQEKKT